MIKAISRHVLPIALAAFMVTGCITTPELRTVDWADIDPGPVPEVDQAREAMAASLAETLKDPYAAQFRNWSPFYKTLYSFDVNAPQEPLWAMCVEMNAKNSMGGYVGFKRYYVKFRDGEPIMDSGVFGYGKSTGTCAEGTADDARVADDEVSGEGPTGYGPNA